VDTAVAMAQCCEAVARRFETVNGRSLESSRHTRAVQVFEPVTAMGNPKLLRPRAHSGGGLILAGAEIHNTVCSGLSEPSTTAPAAAAAEGEVGPRQGGKMFVESAEGARLRGGATAPLAWALRSGNVTCPGSARSP
jgi:hypothetical protein